MQTDDDSSIDISAGEQKESGIDSAQDKITIDISAGEQVEWGIDSAQDKITINDKQKLAEKLEFGVIFEDDTIIIDKQKLAKFFAIQKEKVKVKFN